MADLLLAFAFYFWLGAWLDGCVGAWMVGLALTVPWIDWHIYLSLIHTVALRYMVDLVLPLEH